MNAVPKKDRLEAGYDRSAICLIEVGSHEDLVDLGD
jgi:hypothetical protein